MNISKKLLESLNEFVEKATDSNYEEFRHQIKFLIDDEVEAIEGYENAMNILKDVMTESQNDEIVKIMEHIIEEEKEHIEELIKLQSDLDISKVQ